MKTLLYIFALLGVFFCAVAIVIALLVSPDAAVRILVVSLLCVAGELIAAIAYIIKDSKNGKTK